LISYFVISCFLSLFISFFLFFSLSWFIAHVEVYSNVFEATTQLINEKCQRGQGVEDKKTGEKLAEWVAKMQCSQEVQIQKFHGNLYGMGS
jgi:hypothetical protein